MIVNQKLKQCIEVCKPALDIILHSRLATARHLARFQSFKFFARIEPALTDFLLCRFEFLLWVGLSHQYCGIEQSLLQPNDWCLWGNRKIRSCTQIWSVPCKLSSTAKLVLRPHLSVAFHTYLACIWIVLQAKSFCLAQHSPNFRRQYLPCLMVREYLHRFQSLAVDLP